MRADFFALLDYVDRQSEDQYCTDCLDRLIEQGGPIVRSMAEIQWPSESPDGATPITEQQLMALLRGEPAVAGRARRVITLAHGPFVIVERHMGPGPHPGTGTDQDVHGGDQAALFDVPEGQEGRAPEAAERALRPALARALREVPPNSPFSWTSPHGEFLKGAFRDDKDIVSLSQVHAEVGTLLNAATGEGRGSVMLGEVLAEARRREMTEFHINAASESGRGLLNRFERWGLIEPHETYIDIGGVSEDTATWKLPDMTPAEVRHRVERGLEEEGQTEVLTLRHYGPGPHPGTGTPQAAHGPGKSDYAYAGEIGTSEFDAAMKRVDGEFEWNPDLSGMSPWLMPDGHLTEGRLGVHEVSIITVLEEMGIDRPYGVAEDFHKAMVAAIERGYIRVHVVGHSLGKPQLVVDMHEAAMPTQAQRRTIGDLHTFMEASYGDFDFYYLIREKNGGERAGNSIREAESDGIINRHLGPGDHPSGSPQSVHAGDGSGDGDAYEGWNTKEILEREEEIADLDYEVAMFFSREGFEYRKTDFDPNGVRLGPGIIQALREENEAGRDTMLLHNHPSGWTFSFSDIEFALINGIDEMIVVGNGNRYRMSMKGDIPDHIIWGGTDPESGEQVGGALNVALTIYEETKFTIMPDAPSGQLSQEDITKVRTESLSTAWEAVETAYPEYFEYSEESR